MANFKFNRFNNIINIYNNFNKTSVNNVVIRNSPFLRNNSTSNSKKLMEFFDDEKNWGAQEVKSGRSWLKDELRLKSNTDLHKLWYILLKERNMLLTMEQDGKNQTQLFPSPERLDKVEDSMENLEAVVRERNVAYHQLETGQNGERPGKMKKNAFGLNFYYKMTDYAIPKHMNEDWKKNNPFIERDKDVSQFLLKYREKQYLDKRRKARRDFNHVIGLLNRFPNMDMEALKQEYPDVDIAKAMASRKYKAHFHPDKIESK